LGEIIRQKIENAAGFLKKMTVSVGVASMTAEENNGKMLIDRCDRALYQSKHNGRNCVTALDLQHIDLVDLANKDSARPSSLKNDAQP